MAEPVDPRLLREIVGHYPTGVVAITALDREGRANAMIVGTFTSVSREPPLVAFMPSRSSTSFARIADAPRFAVNILAHDQEALCRALARSDEDKLHGIGWSRSPRGTPVLDDVVAVIECERRSTTTAGDHFIVIGEVIALSANRSAIPLLYFRGGYGGFAPSAIVVSGGGIEISAIAQRMQRVRADLERSAQEFGGELTIFARVGEDSIAVASASAVGTEPITALGTRYPLVPPLGVPLVAWSSELEQESWLDRAIDATDQERARLRRHLSDARAAGWSVSLHGQGELDAPVVGAPGVDLEETTRRDIWRRRIIRSARYLDSEEIEPGRSYEVGAIMVPIFDVPNAPPSLMARLLLFPRASISGTGITARAEALRAFSVRAAHEIVHVDANWSAVG